MNTAVTAVVPQKFYCQSTRSCSLIASWSKPGEAYYKASEKDLEEDEGSDERVLSFEHEHDYSTKEMCNVVDCDFLPLTNVGISNRYMD